jgi:hypothetical protein
MTTEAIAAPRLRTRFFAFAALAGVVSLVLYAGLLGYRALTDSWVAPINLSPDSDAVIQFHVRHAHEMGERAKLSADVEKIDGEVAGIDAAVTRLEKLSGNADKALKWSATVNGQQGAAVNRVTGALYREKKLLEGLLAKQEKSLADAEKNLGAGLIARSERDKEAAALEHLRVAFAANDREIAQAEAQASQLRLAGRALANKEALPEGLMPEMVEREEHMIRVELEVLKLKTEKKALLAQRQIATDGLAKMDEILKTLRARPIYRAIQASTDVAFVPYTQLDGVTAGATVYACTWAIFRCRPVGQVAEVLPGEVVTEDPWGEPARGQYAILSLSDRDAFKEKTLRVRAQ